MVTFEYTFDLFKNLFEQDLENIIVQVFDQIDRSNASQGFNKLDISLGGQVSVNVIKQALLLNY